MDGTAGQHHAHLVCPALRVWVNRLPASSACLDHPAHPQQHRLDGGCLQQQAKDSTYMRCVAN